EITTFFGHANVLGPTGFIDFRLGSKDLATAAELMDAAEAMAGAFAIAHPRLPSSEKCMGCGWTARGTREEKLKLIEVINGGATRAMDGNAEGPWCGVPFWHERLDLGRRIVGIGGSDNHDPTLPPEVPSAVGTPTTLVECEELSERAVLAGLLAGRVAIDLQGVAGRTLDLVARFEAGEGAMGGEIGLPAGEAVEFEIAAACVEGARVEAVGDLAGLEALGRLELDSSGRGRFSLRAAARPAWVRVNLRDRQGKLLMIGNPIWLSPLF
ncbi:MAG: CehA/McbA family metallohydrolase, partial [Caulobacteraceae bacterium]